MNENVLQIATLAVENNRPELEKILLRRGVYFHQYSTNEVLIGRLVEIYRESPDLFISIMNEFPYVEEIGNTERGDGSTWQTILAILTGQTVSTTGQQTQTGSNTAVIIGGGVLVVTLIGLAVWYLSKTN